MVHAIDDLDAKMILALQVTRGTVGPSAGEDGAVSGEGSWTEYVKAFQGRLYKPDVAPADASDGGAIDEPAPEMKPVLNNPLFETVTRREGH